MKYKHIMAFFCVSLPVCVLVRVMQVLFTIDQKGFIKQGYKSLCFKMLVLVCGAVVVTAVIGALTHRCPTHPPKVNIGLGISAAALGVWMLYELTGSPSTAIPVWQTVLLDVFGLTAGLVMIAYGAQAFFKFTLPKLLLALPVAFWIVRLICVFTKLNTLALTSGHFFMLAAYCAILVFMLELAKLMNGLDPEYSFKKLLASALCSITLSASTAIPYFCSAVTGRGDAANEESSAMILIFLTAVFTAVFTVSYFDNHNLKARKHHHGSARFMPEDGNSKDNFYTGYSSH